MALLKFRGFGLALLLSGCMTSPTLEGSHQAATPQQVAVERYYDACLIALTGADRNGQQLSEGAVKGIQAELSDRQVDCGGPVTAAIPAGQTLDSP
jgi:hypothetical protein